MANRSTETDLEGNDGCEKSNYDVYSDTFTKATYTGDKKFGESWKKDEELINIRLRQKSFSSESSDEDTVNESYKNGPSQLQSGRGNSEKISVNFQELMTNESSCQDSDVKPTHSYIALIAMAILSCSSKKMILGDIYEYISDNFPYYRNKDKSWRNSIRHNLSLNECFIKAGRSENGKGNYWAIHPANLEDFANGDFRRRRARRRVRKSSALKFASGTAAYLRSLSMFSPIHHNSMFPFRTSDYRMFSNPYLPGQERKNLAMDAIMSSYEIPSSQLRSSDSTQNIHHTSLSGVPSGGGMLQPYPNSNCQTHTPYLGQQATSKEPNFKMRRLQDGLLSSAFIPYSTTTSHSFSSESESWQETLSKLQEQLRKAP